MLRTRTMVVSVFALLAIGTLVVYGQVLEGGSRSHASASTGGSASGSSFSLGSGSSSALGVHSMGVDPSIIELENQQRRLVKELERVRLELAERKKALECQDKALRPNTLGPKTNRDDLRRRFGDRIVDVRMVNGTTINCKFRNIIEIDGRKFYEIRTSGTQTFLNPDHIVSFSLGEVDSE